MPPQRHRVLYFLMPELVAVTSLVSFAATLGYLPFNVGAALRAPKSDNNLAERDPCRKSGLCAAAIRRGVPAASCVDPAPLRRRLTDKRHRAVALASSHCGRERRDRERYRQGRPDAGRAAFEKHVGRARGASAAGEARVFPISAWNAWDRVRPSGATAMERTRSVAAPTLRPCATPLGTRARLPPGGICTRGSTSRAATICPFRASACSGLSSRRYSG